MLIGEIAMAMLLFALANLIMGICAKFSIDALRYRSKHKNTAPNTQPIVRTKPKQLSLEQDALQNGIGNTRICSFCLKEHDYLNIVYIGHEQYCRKCLEQYPDKIAQRSLKNEC